MILGCGALFSHPASATCEAVSLALPTLFVAQPQIRLQTSKAALPPSSYCRSSRPSLVACCASCCRTVVQHSYDACALHLSASRLGRASLAEVAVRSETCTASPHRSPLPKLSGTPVHFLALANSHVGQPDYDPCRLCTLGRHQTGKLGTPASLQSLLLCCLHAAGLVSPAW